MDNFSWYVSDRGIQCDGSVGQEDELYHIIITRSDLCGRRATFQRPLLSSTPVIIADDVTPLINNHSLFLFLSRCGVILCRPAIMIDAFERQVNNYIAGSLFASKPLRTDSKSASGQHKTATLTTSTSAAGVVVWYHARVPFF